MDSFFGTGEDEEDAEGEGHAEAEQDDVEADPGGSNATEDRSAPRSLILESTSLNGERIRLYFFSSKDLARILTQRKLKF